MSTTSQHLARCDASLPDIASCISRIRHFSAAPVSLRLDYLTARTDALINTGRPTFDAAFNVAAAKLDAVYLALT